MFRFWAAALIALTTATTAPALATDKRVAVAVLAARADTMRDVSSKVTSSVASVSVVVTQNVNASSEMNAMTAAVASSVVMIANDTRSQSAASSELSAACVELAAQMVHINDTAAMLTTESATLAELIGGFNIGAQPTALKTLDLVALM